MRSKNALRNLMFSLAHEAFILALGLIVPRFVILSYGDSINGLTQTITRLLTLVNLLQAGAVGASIFQMLKPVADGDFEKQSAVMYASKKFFDRMGVIYLVIVSVCSVFFGFYLRDESLSVFEIIISFLVLAINGSLYFFFTSRYDIVFSSYQKKYLLTISSFAERVVYYGLLFLVVSGKLHFIFMYAALLCGGIIRVAINTVFYYRLTKGRIVKKPAETDFKIKDRSFLMLASIGDQMVEAAPTVIITTFISLAASSVYSVYALVYISLKSLVNSFHHAVAAIFGNLVATSDDPRVGRVFDSLLYIFMMLGAFLSSCCAFLFMDFIGLYSDGFTDGIYVEPLLAIFIVAYVAIFAVRTVFNFVSHSYGLFKVTCKATLICGAVSLAISVIATVLFGMPYVMLGLLFYHFGTMCVLIHAFKTQIPWFSLKPRWFLRIAVMILLPVASWWLYRSEWILINSWFGWFGTACVYAALVAVCLLAYSAIFERKAMVMLWGYAKAIFKSKKEVEG